jgi:uncharacterized protein (TIGR01244 family)
VKLVSITDRFSVAGQLQAEDYARLRDLGFRTVINNLPDGETESQPGSAAEKAAALAAGLQYAYIPIVGGRISADDSSRFEALVANSAGAVVAHCRSGARSFRLWLQSRHGRALNADASIAKALEIGVKREDAQRWLTPSAVPGRAEVKGFYDPHTFSIQYVVSDRSSGKCAIIDPVLDYDEKSGAVGTSQADALLAYLADQQLTLEWILDTHPHADHLSAASYLKEKTGAPTAIGAHIVDVQSLWRDIYNWRDFPADGRQWDRLFKHGDTFKIGTLDARVMFSPGHTLASITYVIGDAAFVHDTLFMPDYGTARADFPGGNPAALWNSIQDILALPDETRIFTGHDYRPGGREPLWESTVGQQKRLNPHISGHTEESFISLRNSRDATLAMPRLILHALQVNISGGRLPDPESNGKRYLKIPLNALGGSIG